MAYPIRSLKLLRAASYTRASTEFQNFSLENQNVRIAEFVQQHDMLLVRKYSDDGKSGLTAEGRPGLLDLINDIESGLNDFEVLIVQDVSRWGRFQDIDESAYFEFICRKAGVIVEYCAEPFRNDGTSISAIVKNMKRVMAAEYSRDLSAKVFHGQARMIERGYLHGGATPFGYRRMLVDSHGNHKQILEPDQRKAINTDRTVLVLGPPTEIVTIKEIYRLYLAERMDIVQIARHLNAQKLHEGKHWTYEVVSSVLFDEKYIGNTVFNKRSNKLMQGTVKNNPADWIRFEGSHEAIIDKELFAASLIERQQRKSYPTDQHMLESLKALWKKEGRISARLIYDTPKMPSANLYHLRFGSLLAAYKLIGYEPANGRKNIESGVSIFREHLIVVNNLLAAIARRGLSIEFCNKTYSVKIAGRLRLVIKTVPCHLQNGRPKWRAYLEQFTAYDVGIIVRLNHGYRGVLDYYVFPPGGVFGKQAHFGARSRKAYNDYRQADLNVILEQLEKLIDTKLDAYEPPVLIGKKELLAITGLKDDRIPEQMKKGRFPKAIKLCPRQDVWCKADVHAWISANNRTTATGRFVAEKEIT